MAQRSRASGITWGTMARLAMLAVRHQEQNFRCLVACSAVRHSPPSASKSTFPARAIGMIGLSRNRFCGPMPTRANVAA